MSNKKRSKKVHARKGTKIHKVMKNIDSEFITFCNQNGILIEELKSGEFLIKNGNDTYYVGDDFGDNEIWAEKTLGFRYPSLKRARKAIRAMFDKIQHAKHYINHMMMANQSGSNPDKVDNDDTFFDDEDGWWCW